MEKLVTLIFARFGTVASVILDHQCPDVMPFGPGLP